MKFAGVVGAGTMGCGIAMTFADAGIDVALIDADPAALERAASALQGAYHSQVARGKLTHDAAQARLARIARGTAFDGLARAPGRGKTKTGRLWTYVRDERPAAGEIAPAVWFAYNADRKGEHPQQHLEDFRGILQADGYAASRKSATAAGCLKRRVGPTFDASSSIYTNCANLPWQRRHSIGLARFMPSSKRFAVALPTSGARCGKNTAVQCSMR
jgi:glycine/D-amino acid oxidase-like deaminating enzyme